MLDLEKEGVLETRRHGAGVEPTLEARSGVLWSASAPLRALVSLSFE